LNCIKQCRWQGLWLVSAPEHKTGWLIVQNSCGQEDDPCHAALRFERSQSLQDGPFYPTLQVFRAGALLDVSNLAGKAFPLHMKNASRRRRLQ